VVALLAGEALQVVHVVPGPHHHLEGRNHFRARSAVSSVAKQPANKWHVPTYLDDCETLTYPVLPNNLQTSDTCLQIEMTVKLSRVQCCLKAANKWHVPTDWETVKLSRVQCYQKTANKWHVRTDWDVCKTLTCPVLPNNLQTSDTCLRIGMTV
jgi:beta-glucanase (GH16 family)